MYAICCVLLLSSAMSAFAFPENLGYSGAPGRQTCASSCHGVAGGTVTVTGFPAIYTPNQNYLITIQRLSGSSIANFNGSARVGTGSVNAGILSAGTGTSTYNMSGETNGIHLTSNNQTSAAFNWTAPVAGTGTVRLYVGAHQGGYSGPNSTIVAISEEEVVVPPDAPLELVILPETPDVLLSWAAVTGATTYNVYRAATPDVPIDAGHLIGSSAATTFTDPGVLSQSNLQFFYAVTAANP